MQLNAAALPDAAGHHYCSPARDNARESYALKREDLPALSGVKTTDKRPANILVGRRSAIITAAHIVLRSRKHPAFH